MSSSFEIVWAREAQKWNRTLVEVGNYDFYHLAEYHLIKHGDETPEPVMFVYREHENLLVWPFLLRDLTAVRGLADVGARLRDATSVYGYPGPLGTPTIEENTDLLRRFARSVEPACKDLGIVNLFSRMNPILNNAALVRDWGSLERKGETVYIDLTESPQRQWSQFHRNCRYDIRKARKDGLVVVRDEKLERIDQFAGLYAATMEKVGGRKDLCFGIDYFLQLKKVLGTSLSLFLAEKQGKTIAASLFVHTGPIIQYHLSARDVTVVDRSAARAIIDDARIWGNQLGARVLHLGGGVSAQNDGVYQFKGSFSPKRFDFYVWKHVLMKKEYDLLVKARREWLSSVGLTLPDTDFFPLFRADPELHEANNARVF